MVFRHLYPLRYGIACNQVRSIAFLLAQHDLSASVLLSSREYFSILKKCLLINGCVQFTVIEVLWKYFKRTESSICHVSFWAVDLISPSIFLWFFAGSSTPHPSTVESGMDEVLENFGWTMYHVQEMNVH